MEKVMNRRVQGRVKQARKRLQKRIDIRAGRRVSMFQMMHAHNHEEDVVETTLPLVQEETPVVDSTATHMLVRRDTSLVDGKEVEAELQRGTESQMRRQRAISMEANPEGVFSVRKIKVAV
jgi:hypothetical protein